MLGSQQVPEAEIPLPVPKKTKFFLELAEREKQEFADMHQLFQRDLFMLRVKAARAYVKVLTDGQGPVSYSAGSSLRMHTTLMGLGPTFKLRLSLLNSGNRPVRDLTLIARFDEELYSVNPIIRTLPSLVPGIEYSVDLGVLCLAPELGITGEVTLLACQGDSPVPLMACVTKMPSSDISLASMQ